MSEYKIHPIAKRLPDMTAEEFDGLVASITTNGLREPIVLLDEKILDGRHRYRACKQARVEPRFRTLKPGENPWRLVWDANAHRRHLTEYQKAACWYRDFAKGSAEWDAENAKRSEEANIHLDDDSIRGDTINTLAGHPPRLSRLRNHRGEWEPRVFFRRHELTWRAALSEVEEGNPEFKVSRQERFSVITRVGSPMPTCDCGVQWGKHVDAAADTRGAAVMHSAECAPGRADRGACIAGCPLAASSDNESRRIA